MKIEMIHDNLFIEDSEGKMHLRGSRCRDCGKMIFPANEGCVYCLGNNMEDIPLSDTGVIYSYTTTYRPVAHFEPPHTMGIVELPENVRVTAPLIGGQEDYHCGDKVELVIGTHWIDKDEHTQEEIDHVGHWFKKIEKGGDEQ